MVSPLNLGIPITQPAPLLQAPVVPTAAPATQAAVNPALTSPQSPTLTASPAAGAASTLGVAGTPQGAAMQGETMLCQVLKLLCTLLCTMLHQGSGGANFSLPATTASSLPVATSPAAVATPTTASGGTTTSPATPPPANNGRLKIAQIDLFTGSNHGQTIANVLRNGGGDPSLAGRIDLLQIDVGGGGSSSQKINNGLQSLIQRVQSGERIDAVNISLADFQESGASQQTRALIDQLGALGVPVAVAAGNNGPRGDNRLEGATSFNVQSATNGRLNGNSGLGNITSEGATTSVATANLVPILAARRAQGLSLSQIRASL